MDLITVIKLPLQKMSFIMCEPKGKWKYLWISKWMPFSKALTNCTVYTKHVLLNLCFTQPLSTAENISCLALKSKWFQMLKPIASTYNYMKNFHGEMRYGKIKSPCLQFQDQCARYRSSERNFLINTKFCKLEGKILMVPWTTTMIKAARPNLTFMFWWAANVSETIVTWK